MSIELIDIEKQFGAGTPAVSGVSFKVEDGQLVALLGPSGSGKSTILRLISGLLAPDSGRILMHGSDVTRTPVQQRNVGFVFQNYALFKHMTVENNIAFGLQVRKRPRAEIAERVGEMLSVMKLDGKGGRYPAQLSGGERQRVAIARALAPRPEILLLDEPFGAIDNQVRIELRDWLRQLHDTLHVTSLFVTHDQDEAMEISDRVVVMSHGRLEQVGSPKEVFENPANPFVTGFLGQVNSLHGTSSDGVTEVGSLRVSSSEISGSGVPVSVLVRPTDIRIRPAIDGPFDGTIARIAYLGPVVKVDVDLTNGDRLVVHTSREEYSAMTALALEWGKAWPTEATGDSPEPHRPPGVVVEIREARVYAEDFSI